MSPEPDLVVLGIESSCDETAAAVVSSTGEVLSDVVKSQVATHAAYGGIVPEVASRDHVRAIKPVVDEALRRAHRTLASLDGIAVTNRPGLSGALLVGLSAAKGIAWAAAKPLVGVDHLVGHILSVFLRRPDAPPQPKYPFIALIASGGHTALFDVRGPLPELIEELGATRDDAAGEAFDKVGKMLGLGYPAGPVIDKLAASGDPSAFAHALPIPMAHRRTLELSFSGLKTAARRHLDQRGALSDQELKDFCAAFQHAVVESMTRKVLLAVKTTGQRRVVLGGGVAANRGLRERLRTVCADKGIELFVPPLASCTDNAAMIAYAGTQRLSAGQTDTFSLAPATKTILPRHTRKGRGPRQTP